MKAKKFTLVITQKERAEIFYALRGAAHWHNILLCDGGQYEESDPARKRHLTRTKKLLRRARQTFERKAFK